GYFNYQIYGHLLASPGVLIAHRSAGGECRNIGPGMIDRTNIEAGIIGCSFPDNSSTGLQFELAANNFAGYKLIGTAGNVVAAKRLHVLSLHCNAHLSRSASFKHITGDRIKNKAHGNGISSSEAQIQIKSLAKGETGYLLAQLLFLYVFINLFGLVVLI